MTNPTTIARSLSEAARACVVPGPGNPEYAHGRKALMDKLQQIGIVWRVNTWTTNGGRGGRLTEFGRAVRAAILAEQEGGA